jgi:hypothetical protein
MSLYYVAWLWYDAHKYAKKKKSQLYW